MPVASSSAPGADPTPAQTTSPAPTETPGSTPAVANPSPLPEIEILAPGPGSSLASPVQLSARLQPGAGGLVRVELLGGRGQLLARYLLRLPATNAEDKRDLSLEVPFEINGAEEPARLAASVEDGFGRLRALSSVELTLLAPGTAETIQPADLHAPIIIRQPPARAERASGVIEVSGQVRAHSDRPLTVYAFNREGRRLAFAEPYPGEPDAGGYAGFETTLTIQVDEAQWVQIVVTETGATIDGEVAVATIEVFVIP